MLLIRAGKVVCATEVFLCAHVDEVVVHMVKHGIDAGNRRNADGAWG